MGALRRLVILATIAVVALWAAGPAQAGQRSKRPSGIKGVVLNTTCYGACPTPAPPAPAYTGSDLTITVTRVADGAPVGSQHPSDGHFRFRLKRGLYRVTAAIAPSPVQPQSRAMPPSCWQGDSREARVHRHRYTRVELHVGNVCIV